MITWLIEKDVYDDGTCERLAQAVQESGCQVKWFQYPGFNALIEPKNLLDIGFLDPIIVYGSLNAAKVLQRKTNWIPGLWCDFEKLRCRNYLAHWGKFSIHQEYCFLPRSEVIRKKDWIYSTFGDTCGQIFIRPDDNSKSFHGEVVHKNEFEHWVKVSQFQEPGDNCLTIVSKPSSIESEWRLVIADQKVVSASRYKTEGRLVTESGCPDVVRSLAEEIVQTPYSCPRTAYQPDSIFIMDICSTVEKTYHLLEIGSFNCAGFYGLDLEAIVKAANIVAKRDWEDIYA